MFKLPEIVKARSLSTQAHKTRHRESNLFRQDNENLKVIYDPEHTDCMFTAHRTKSSVSSTRRQL